MHMGTFVFFSGNGLVRATQAVRKWADKKYEEYAMSYENFEVVVIDSEDGGADTQYAREEGWEPVSYKDWKVDDSRIPIIIIPNYPVDYEIFGQTCVKASRLADQTGVMFMRLTEDGAEQVTPCTTWKQELILTT